ncbi:MAG: hypothetical protein LC775_20405 [Acidobacteria bacterium]|nr:hypothetical protein [Acidobacteriota bacterium]
MDERVTKDNCVPEGLRGRAERECAEQQKLESAGAGARAAEEETLLRAKLIELGAAEAEITITREGGHIVAEIEGMRFISAFNDPYLRVISETKESRLPAVILLRKCPDCGHEHQSGIIRRVAELGKELKDTQTNICYSCQGRRDGPAGARRECDADDSVH